MRAFDRAGGYTQVRSSGFDIDTSAPLSGHVIDVPRKINWRWTPQLPLYSTLREDKVDAMFEYEEGYIPKGPGTYSTSDLDISADDTSFSMAWTGFNDTEYGLAALSYEVGFAECDADIEVVTLYPVTGERHSHPYDHEAHYFNYHAHSFFLQTTHPPPPPSPEIPPSPPTPPPTPPPSPEPPPGPPPSIPPPPPQPDPPPPPPSTPVLWPAGSAKLGDSCESSYDCAPLEACDSRCCAASYQRTSESSQCVDAAYTLRMGGVLAPWRSGCSLIVDADACHAAYDSTEPWSIRPCIFLSDVGICVVGSTPGTSQCPFPPSAISSVPTCRLEGESTETSCTDFYYLQSLPTTFTWLPTSTASASVCAPVYALPMGGRRLHHDYVASSVNSLCPLLPSSASCRLTHNTSYCAVVRAVNIHGIQSERVRSNGVRICTQPPVAGVVWDQDGDLPALLDFVGTPRNITCAWSGFRDACALGIETYRATLQRVEVNGTLTDLAFVVVGVHSTPARRSHEFYLPGASVYRCRVCGTAATGLKSCAYSDGVVLDLTPPLRGELCLGTGVQERCDSDGDAYVDVASDHVAPTATFFWRGFDDSESSLSGFFFAVGSSAGASDIVPWNYLGWATQTQVARSILAPGIAFATVRSINGAGLETNVSLRLQIDATPPTLHPGAVALDGALVLGGDGVAYSNMSAVRIRISATDIKNSVSSVTSVTCDIHEALGMVVHSETLDPTASHFQVFDFDATAHEAYSLECAALNAAGLVGTSTPLRFMFDPALPRIAKAHVCNATTGEEMVAQVDTDSILICVDDVGLSQSQLLGIQVVIKLQSTSELVHERLLFQPWYDRLNLTGLSLPCGGDLAITLATLSNADVSSLPLELRLQIDCTSPFTSSIHIGNHSSDRAHCVAPGAEVFVHWPGVVEEESPPLAYEWAVANWQETSPLLGWTRSSRPWASVNTSLGMEAAPAAYTVLVRACNSVALCADDVGAAHPLMLVHDRPLAGAVELDTYQTFLTKPSFISGSWSAFSDASEGHSPLKYSACVGTTPFGCQALPVRSVDGTSWDETGLSLTCGALHYLTVRAIPYPVRVLPCHVSQRDTTWCSPTSPHSIHTHRLHPHPHLHPASISILTPTPPKPPPCPSQPNPTPPPPSPHPTPGRRYQLCWSGGRGVRLGTPLLLPARGWRHGTFRCRRQPDACCTRRRERHRGLGGVHRLLCWR